MLDFYTERPVTAFFVVYVIVSYRSSGPLLRSGAPHDKRTEVGVSE